MKCGCGATKEVTLKLDAANHETVVTDKAVAPTCETTGLTEGSHCSACDTVIVEQETVDKLGHDFTVFVETVDYTCDEDGYDVYKCSRCDETENKNFTDAACRPEADYTVIEKGSCDKAGYKAILCSECDKELETETIAKRDHNIVDTTVETVATCITEGVMNQKCDCAENEEYEACTYTTTRSIPVDANNHEGTANIVKNAKDATCYAEGYTGDIYWSCCDVLYAKGEATEKIAHTPAEAIEENRTESTCKEEGSYDSVVYCSVCGEELDRDTIDLPLAEHTEAAAVEENRTESTCKVAGSYDSVVYCSVCDEELSRETFALPLAEHIYSVASATYNEDKIGTIVYICDVCGDEKSETGLFNLENALEAIAEAEEKLISDELAESEKESLESALEELKVFLSKYIVYDENGTVVENNLPLDDNTIMTEYHSLLNNLLNVLSGKIIVGPNKEQNTISMLFELIIMLLELVFKFVMYIKAN